MIKNIISALCISFSVSVFCQETLITFQNDLKTSSSDIKDVIPVVNTETDEIAFFVADAKNVYGYKIDADFKVSEKITSEEKRRKYKVIIGSSASNDDSYRVFLTNKNQTDFASVRFSFKYGSTSLKEFSIDRNETFIQTVVSKNKFYLIAASRLYKSLSIYTFNENGDPQKHNINIADLRFIDTKGKNKALTSLLLEGEDLNKFEENTPNSIELTSEFRKMFVRDHTILITLDHHKMFTQVLQIDLNTLLATSFQFRKPKLGEKAKRTNSYLNGDHLFTLATTKDEFTVEILDFATGNLVKEYSATKNDSITFKNTPIIQEGGIYDSSRELGKTKRFLRKIAKGNTGLSVRKVKNRFHLTIGGYIVQNTGGGMMMPFGGIPIGSIGAVTVFFNPTQLAFNSFTNNKTTRIESLLDSDFNHIQGDIEENAFDKMKEFKSNNKGGTVFKYKDFFIKARYNSSSKEFNFKKFTD